MVLSLIWTHQARDDLREIHDYIARDSPLYARMQIERIRRSMQRAQAFPASGRVVPEFPHRGWREVLVNNYRAVFRVDREGKNIVVLGVIHGRQRLSDMPLVATEREFKKRNGNDD